MRGQDPCYYHCESFNLWFQCVQQQLFDISTISILQPWGKGVVRFYRMLNGTLLLAETLSTQVTDILTTKGDVYPSKIRFLYSPLLTSEMFTRLAAQERSILQVRQFLTDIYAAIFVMIFTYEEGIYSTVFEQLEVCLGLLTKYFPPCQHMRATDT